MSTGLTIACCALKAARLIPRPWREAPLREILYPFRGCEESKPDDPESLRWGDDYDKILVEKIALFR
jgi:hypothetical protein